MLEIQKHLAVHPLESLESLHISAKRHARFANLVMLKYQQREASMGERIVQECRGIILNQAAGWSVVSRPYDKFFNLGEPFAAPIDWSSARVYEKLDGSLMTLYWYKGEWHVASSGQPDAGGPAGVDSDISFAELFWLTWKSLGYSLPASHNHCYMFELCTPHNRVVVPHETSGIYLHGARDVQTGEEKHPRDVANPEWMMVNSYDLGSEEACVAAAKILTPLEHEGYVVCDARFHRVKIKSPKYVAIAQAKEGFTYRKMLELVLSGEAGEFLTYFPEMRPDFDRATATISALVARIEDSYEKLRTIESQKEFATEALRTMYSPVLFSLRAGKVKTAREFLASAPIAALERMIG